MKIFLQKVIALIRQYMLMRKIAKESARLQKDFNKFKDLLDDIRIRTDYTNSLIKDYNNAYGANIETITKI